MSVTGPGEGPTLPADVEAAVRARNERLFNGKGKGAAMVRDYIRILEDDGSLPPVLVEDDGEVCEDLA